MIQAPGLTHEHQTRPVRLARDIHYNLLQAFVNYGRKTFFQHWGQGAPTVQERLQVQSTSLFHTNLTLGAALFLQLVFN
jgi:hypothetical protein